MLEPGSFSWAPSGKDLELRSMSPPPFEIRATEQIRRGPRIEVTGNVVCYPQRLVRRYDPEILAPVAAHLGWSRDEFLRDRRVVTREGPFIASQAFGTECTCSGFRKQSAPKLTRR